MRDDAPQTVGQAVQMDWAWLRLRCAICRHSGRIELSSRPVAERLGDIVRRARCSRCRRPTILDTYIGADRYPAPVYEKQVEFEGGRMSGLSLPR